MSVPKRLFNQSSSVRRGVLEIDVMNHVVRRDGRVENLSEFDAEFLSVMGTSFKHPSEIIRLLTERYGAAVSEEQLAVYASRIRGKMGKDAIESKYGWGYRIKEQE